MLSGDNGTFKVAVLRKPAWTPLSLYVDPSDPIQAPLTDDSGYWNSTGVFVYSPGSTYPTAWEVWSFGASPPHAAAEAQGQKVLDSWAPSTAFTGAYGDYDRSTATGGLGNDSYIVAYGYGARSGALTPVGASGRWSVSVNTGYTCEEIDVPGELISYNQTHFTGGTQVYVPPVGYGSGLKLAHDTGTRDLLAGSVYAWVAGLKRPPPDGDVGGEIDLAYKYPPNGGNLRLGTKVNDHFRKRVGPRGTYSFTLDYYGAAPIANFTFVQLDMPW